MRTIQCIASGAPSPTTTSWFRQTSSNIGTSSKLPVYQTRRGNERSDLIFTSVSKNNYAAVYTVAYTYICLIFV